MSPVYFGVMQMDLSGFAANVGASFANTAVVLTAPVRLGETRRGRYEDTSLVYMDSSEVPASY